jgi:hypothetical protein
MSRFLLTAAAATALVAVALPAAAHHSFAMFDREKQVTISGTVKEFQWTNPHVFIQLMVPGAGGKAEEWSIEGGSPNMLFRQGWEPTAFKPGDKVSIVINPLKSGERGGNFVFTTLPNGKTLGNMNAKAPG